MRPASGSLRPLLLSAALPALVVAAAACRESGASAGVSLVTDSAGVAIVESREAAWRQGEELVLSAEPAVAIGEEEGGAEYQFGSIGDAVRLSDGRLVVVDGQAAEVRAYDADGRFLWKAGGKGSGPGEFQFVLWMRRLPGDSLMLMDMMSQRITVLASDGSVARSVNLAQAAPPPSSGGDRQERVRFVGMGRYFIVAPFADGSLLARVQNPGGPSETGISRDSVTYVRLNPDGTLRDTVGVLPGDERQTTAGGSGENRFMMTGPPPFGRTAQLAVAGDAFYFGSTDRYEIRRIGGDGRLQRLVRRPVEPRPVTEADLEALKRRDLENAEAQSGNAGFPMRRMIEAKWENVVAPPTMPAHGAIEVDAAGRLWVRETPVPSAAEPAAGATVEWTVFDPEGRMLGAVRVPAALRVLEIGDDWLLGVHRDEYDVQQLRLHTLHRAPAP